MNKKIIIFVIVVVVAAVGAGLIAMLSSFSGPAQSADTASNAKLNINEICQGALAYMSFNSSVEADAFVQECVDGKHPEVIEKWKQDNGITDDRAI